MTDRTDALWAEMQATLEEVELSASGGTRVFGPDHEQRLAELRQAQIALAQAWARSEADEAIGTTLSTSEGDSRTAKAAAPGTKEGASAGAAADAGGRPMAAALVGRAPAQQAAAWAPSGWGRKWSRRTAQDILLAKKRREANDPLLPASQPGRAGRGGQAGRRVEGHEVGGAGEQRHLAARECSQHGQVAGGLTARRPDAGTGWSWRRLHSRYSVQHEGSRTALRPSTCHSRAMTPDAIPRIPYSVDT